MTYVRTFLSPQLWDEAVFKKVKKYVTQVANWQNILQQAERIQATNSPFHDRRRGRKQLNFQFLRVMICYLNGLDTRAITTATGLAHDIAEVSLTVSLRLLGCTTIELPDIGCDLGAYTHTLRQAIPQPIVEIHGPPVATSSAEQQLLVPPVITCRGGTYAALKRLQSTGFGTTIWEMVECGAQELWPELYPDSTQQLYMFNMGPFAAVRDIVVGKTRPSVNAKQLSRILSKASERGLTARTKSGEWLFRVSVTITGKGYSRVSKGKSSRRVRQPSREELERVFLFASQDLRSDNEKLLEQIEKLRRQVMALEEKIGQNNKQIENIRLTIYGATDTKSKRK